MRRRSYRVSFPGGSGFELAGIVDESSSDDAPVAVFSHCFTCNKDLKAIVRISRALADHGITVLRYDMTGLGGSQGDFSRTNFTTNLADLGEAIAFAETNLGSVSSLIGHSFGGVASLATAAKRSELGSVVTLAAPSDTQHLATLLERMDPRIASEGIGQVTIGGREYSIRNEMLDDFRGHDVPKQLATVQTPTLLLHSPVDETVGFDHALRIMGLIKGSSAAETAVSLVSIAEADHLLSNNADDLEFVAQVAAAFIHRHRHSA